MNKIPKPKILTLDPNDENIILGIPDDIDPSKIQQGTINLIIHIYWLLYFIIIINSQECILVFKHFSKV